MHQCRLYGGASLPFGLTKADANISSAINPFGFCEHLLLERFLPSLIIRLFGVLSDRRQFVHFIPFQPYTPDTMLYRWPAIDVYHPGHDSFNNDTRWFHLSRGIAYLSCHIQYFCRESALVVTIRCLPLSTLIWQTFASAALCRLVFLQIKAGVLSSVPW